MFGFSLWVCLAQYSSHLPRLPPSLSLCPSLPPFLTPFVAPSACLGPHLWLVDGCRSDSSKWNYVCSLASASETYPSISFHSPLRPPLPPLCLFSSFSPLSFLPFFLLFLLPFFSPFHFVFFHSSFRLSIRLSFPLSSSFLPFFPVTSLRSLPLYLSFIYFFLSSLLFSFLLRFSLFPSFRSSFVSSPQTTQNAGGFI